MNLDLSPIAHRELRARMRGARAYTLLAIYLGIISGIALLMYVLAAYNYDEVGGSNRSIGRPLYYMIVGMQLVLVCFIAPAFTCNAIVGEKERQTFDLLRASLLSASQIAGGKLIASLGFVLLLVFATLPLFGLALTLGGVEPAQMLVALCIVVASAVSFSVLGLYVSTRARTSVGATVLTYGVMLAVVLGLPVLVLIVAAFVLPTLPARPELTDAVTAFLVYAGSLSPVGALTAAEGTFSASGRIWTFELTAIGRPAAILLAPTVVFVLWHTVWSGALFGLAVRRIARSDTSR